MKNSKGIAEPFGNTAGMVEIPGILEHTPDTIDDEVGIFRIPDVNHSWFKQKINRINKIAREVSAKPVTVDYLESYYVQAYGKNVPDPKTGGILVYGPIPGKVIHYFKVRVTGEPPKFKGWEFIANVHWTPAGNILSKVPGYVDNLPENMRSGSLVCEYCGTTRKRTDTFVVRNLETNVLQTVGRNCLGKFLGHSDPSNIARMATWANDIREELAGKEDDEEDLSFGRQYDPYISLTHFLATTVAVVEKHGWVSKSATIGRENMTSTVARVLSQIYPNFRDKYRERIAIEPRHVDKAKEIIDFARSDALRTDTDYKHNLKVATAGPVVHRDHIGLVASLVNFTDRSLEQEKEMAAKRAQWDKEKADREAEKEKHEFVGNPGDRIQVPVRVVYWREITGGNFGITYLLKMKTAADDMLTWFASNPPSADDLDNKEQWYMLTGTVKDTEVYRDEKQTIVTRCKLEPIQEQTAKESIQHARYSLAGKSAKKKKPAKSDRSEMTVGGTI